MDEVRFNFCVKINEFDIKGGKISGISSVIWSLL